TPTTSPGGGQVGNLQLSFNPSYVLLQSTSDCATSFAFALTGTETSGVGINLSNLSIAPEGFSWPLPFLKVPARVNANGTFTTNLTWCRGPGISTFTISGTDDKGNSGSWSGQITF